MPRIMSQELNVEYLSRHVVLEMCCLMTGANRSLFPFWGAHVRDKKRNAGKLPDTEPKEL